MSQNSVYPKNAITTATHGSYYMPREWVKRLHKGFRANLLRLTRNYSDFETRKLLPESAPIQQKLSAWFSRALGDPNRAPNTVDLTKVPAKSAAFQLHDFAGVPIWESPPTMLEQQALLRQFHEQYHGRIRHMIVETMQTQSEVILFDIHDTGNVLLNPEPKNDHDRPNHFPEIVVGNCYGKSCRAEIFDLFVQNLEREFGCEVAINAPYAGGFVTKTYGKSCNAIQIEFDRSTMNEHSQRANRLTLKERAMRLQKAIVATAQEFAM